MTSTDDRERDARICADLARRAKLINLAQVVCRCDHPHPAGAVWCYVCDFPLADVMKGGTVPP